MQYKTIILLFVYVHTILYNCSDLIIFGHEKMIDQQRKFSLQMRFTWKFLYRETLSKQHLAETLSCISKLSVQVKQKKMQSSYMTSHCLVPYLHGLHHPKVREVIMDFANLETRNFKSPPRRMLSNFEISIVLHRSVTDANYFQ